MANKYKVTVDWCGKVKVFLVAAWSAEDALVQLNTSDPDLGSVRIIEPYLGDPTFYELSLTGCIKLLEPVNG